MLTFYFSSFKKKFQLLIPKIFSIFTFGLSFKVNSYVEFIFLNKILQKNYNIIKISKKKIRIF